MRRGKKLWLVGAAVAFVHNITAEDGDTLSEVMDDWLKSDRWVTELLLLALYCHLSNRIKPQYDPIHLLFVALIRLMRRRRVAVEPAPMTS